MSKIVKAPAMTSGLLHAADPREIRLKKLKARTRKDCRILYPNGGPGWECGIGWTDALSKLSYKIECMNRLFMREFQVYAAADQVKEKFGELRFYYTVHRAAPPQIRIMRDTFKNFADCVMHNTNFKMKSVIVKPASVKIKCAELPSGIEEDLSLDTTVLEAPDGFKCAVRKIHSYEISKRVPTRMRPLWHIANMCYKVATWLIGLYPFDTNRQNIGIEALDDFVEKALREAENKCYSTCERCGNEIGTDYSPRCETVGWITYICERCAVKQGGKYRKDDGVYKDGKLVEPLKKSPYGDEDCACDEGSCA